MTNQPEPENSLEIIDFRKLILILWYGKWIILGAAVFTGLIAFLISSNLVPERYRASAIITVNVQNTWRELIEKGISQMARSDEIIDQTFEELGITDPEALNPLEFVAYMEYWGKLELEVRAGDPALAANTVNIWADQVYQGIYDLLGMSQWDQETLEEQVAQAEDSWIIATNDLNDYLSQRDLVAYSDTLSATESTLIAYREVIDRNRLLISDSLSLEAQLAEMNASDTLALGVVLSLVNLQGRAGALDEDIIQLSVEDLSPDLNLSPAEALKYTELFRVALERQNQILLEEVATLESRIVDLEISLELAQSHIDDLTLKRDLARSNYESLANQLTNFQITKNQIDQYVVISTRALPPKETDHPQILVITGFSCISGTLVAILGLLFCDWWKARRSA